MHLRDAIDQITTIRSQLAATEHLKSLRAVPVAVSGLLAITAAILQQFLLEEPLSYPRRYLLIWCSAALLSGVLASAVVARRTLRCPMNLSVANAWLAVRQFAPSLVVGAIVTWFVVARIPHMLWLLPGLWQLLFGLGNLAAHRLLPAPAFLVGVSFVATGTVCLWFGEAALDPWAMGLPFAAGQLALAAILWWHHERAEFRFASAIGDDGMETDR
ncbi:MAG: hypothetical protein H6835_10665 [Planctomycetes bacterium]|nr:hypothetical protein [Planctomycetota bacterium]